MPAADIPVPSSVPVRRSAAWLAEGARTLFFLHPRWQGLGAGPGVLAVLVLAGILLSAGLQRLAIAGPAHFYWQAVASGWAGIALSAWGAWAIRYRPPGRPAGDTAPGAAHLVALLLAQGLFLTLLFGAFFVLSERGLVAPPRRLGGWAAWTVWLLPGAWAWAAQAVLFWRAGNRRRLPWLAAMLAAAAATALVYAVRTPDFWYADDPDDDSGHTWRLTQEVAEAQAPLLERRLAALQPGRAGRVEVFTLVYAPYAHDVFRRESAMVADVMGQRFDARQRTLQLVNNPGTLADWPWATPLNLRRALERIGRTMNRDEDILFLHLTSHGAKDGRLASWFAPLEVDALQPAQLKAWLDAAGIRHRVISVSACYSGSWIAPLADEDTLVMTAADAEHTSYGCGSRSELTFFGRAMYDEQLRNRTRSFEDAFAAARQVIARREQEAGKDDGYSNPQMRMGAGIRARLEGLRRRLEAEGAGTGSGGKAAAAGP